ncbi:hypothetical protein [Heyndrickxia acidicola]|uniref:Spore coat protein n=1 Tax=Heyndrickxia acidicola TaxID=209389 RepID=A0ABU6MJ41_9BACI|nr:hypothetical protein [Heyndrickxia acidicola]MED1204691.1 hypothetical protein [Heyndrickxia acidicola]
MTEEPKSAKDQMNEISQSVMNVMVGSILKRNNAKLNKDISDEEKAKLRQMVEDLKKQVESFVENAKSEPITVEPTAEEQPEEKPASSSRRKNWRRRNETEN